ncbi:5'-AMP-activated protein kinase subunit beta-2 [Trichinella zimbabwensis]|uniref:5'-AMP-activated protein kinase subunit beta-1 n=1 Tax=Trichinella zimbabwensis TaxID=268475 RepID=A0A0V1HEZ0_9BILA|nr:5'-AMP-activated protein kinase subunit beta-2 [Trichinella zimbabwensis]
MGNTQGSVRRDRHESDGSVRKVGNYSDDDQCPVQLKISRIKNETYADANHKDRGGYPVVVKWTGFCCFKLGNAKSVSLGGSWDGWKKKLTMVRSHEDFITIVNLPEGRHEFKFYVDGSWICDNNLPKTDNPLGSENNVLVIDRSDYEVFDALDRDQAASVTDNSTSSCEECYNKNSSYTQELPEVPVFRKYSEPPVLPPHLLQVILNKDTPISCDPNVLPEPNHVMLNHLYALSIKDGVMVLSATHRFRKKYVTTLLYKPI